MLFRSVVIHADDPTLRDGEVASNRVRVPDESAELFFGGMVDSAVAVELAVDGCINRRFIGHDVRSAINSFTMTSRSVFRLRSKRGASGPYPRVRPATAPGSWVRFCLCG